MEKKLQDLLAKMSSAEGTGNMDDEEFLYSEQIKHAINILLEYPHKLRGEQILMLMDQFGITKQTAVKRFAEAIELFPSMEKVNKQFERARISRFCYQFLMLCATKGNTRDAAQYIKLIKEIWGLDEYEDLEAAATQSTIINMLKSSPESLGIKLPEGFVLETFINELEGEYDRKREAGKPE